VNAGPWKGIVMSTTEREPIEGVQYISAAEAREVFDYQARKLMGMSGEEFLRRWDEGEFRDLFDKRGHEDLTHLVLMMGLGRAQD
jgi:hypothetical protein